MLAAFHEKLARLFGSDQWPWGVGRIALDHRHDLRIHELERRLKQGKLSFASEARMEKYLGVKPGSVSPLALINDTEKHVHVFLDENLQHATKISFHPNVNTASIVISFSDFIKFLNFVGNKWEFSNIY